LKNAPKKAVYFFERKQEKIAKTEGMHPDDFYANLEKIF